MRRVALVLAVLILPLCLTACGFHLRGMGNTAPFAFKRLYVSAQPAGVGDSLAQLLSYRPDVTVVPKAEQAEAELFIEQEGVDKQILSINRGGRVSEYELIFHMSMRLNLHNQEVISPTALTLRRSYSFDDTNLLGKDAEEQLLIRDMRTDAAQQIMRRLAAAKPLPPTVEGTPVKP